MEENKQTITIDLEEYKSLIKNDSLLRSENEILKTNLHKYKTEDNKTSITVENKQNIEEEKKEIKPLFNEEANWL